MLSFVPHSLFKVQPVVFNYSLTCYIIPPSNYITIDKKGINVDNFIYDIIYIDCQITLC